MALSCVVLADAPPALLELCGISIVERLLRTVQRTGVTQVTVLSSTTEPISVHLAKPSWARAKLNLTVQGRSPGPITIEQIVKAWPQTDSFLMVVRGDTVFDNRLLQLLATQEASAALVDSAIEPRLQQFVSAVPETSAGKSCGAIVLRRDWTAAQRGDFDEAIARGLSTNEIRALDVNEQPVYSPGLRRKLRPYWFPAPAASLIQAAEGILLDSVQKGTQDLPARVHAPIEKFLVARLCRTKVTPHQISCTWIAFAFITTFLFATGHLAGGIVLALIIGILDGLDGKQARLKVETSRAGRIEHWFDSFFDLIWPTALAWHFYSSGSMPKAFFYLGLLLAAETADAIGKLGVYVPAEKSLVKPDFFDTIVRLLGGRRNFYTWTLAVCVFLGRPERALIIMAYWEIATAVVDLLHAGWIRYFAGQPAVLSRR